jgi:hypothetical protein
MFSMTLASVCCTCVSPSRFLISCKIAVNYLINTKKRRGVHEALIFIENDDDPE